jgi:hypothetical protein
VPGLSSFSIPTLLRLLARSFRFRAQQKAPLFRSGGKLNDGLSSNNISDMHVWCVELQMAEKGLLYLCYSNCVDCRSQANTAFGAAICSVSLQYSCWPFECRNLRLAKTRHLESAGRDICLYSDSLQTRRWVVRYLAMAADMLYCSTSQTVVRGPQVVLGFCPCGPLRLNISPKNTEKC